MPGLIRFHLNKNDEPSKKKEDKLKRPEWWKIKCGWTDSRGYD